MTDLKELKRLAEMATPGPWRISKDGKQSRATNIIQLQSYPMHSIVNASTGLDKMPSLFPPPIRKQLLNLSSEWNWRKRKLQFPTNC